MKINPESGAYENGKHCADRDAATVVELLEIMVEEGCDYDRTGMTPAQVAVTDRIDTLAALARDIAIRLSEGVFGNPPR